MRAADTINALVFVAILAAIGAGIVDLQSSRLSVLPDVRQVLADAEGRKATLHSRLVAFATGRDHRQGTLVAEYVALDGVRESLHGFLDSMPTDRGGVRDALHAAEADLEQMLSRVDRMRSMAAVLKYSHENLPKLLRSLERRASGNPPLKAAVERLASLLPQLGTAAHDRATPAVTSACDALTNAAEGGGKTVESHARLAAAQARTSARYHGFLLSDLSQLNDDARSGVLEAQLSVDRAIRSLRARDDRGSTRLASASLALAAFVVGLVVRLWRQSRSLRRLNSTLEDRVAERTRELDSERRRFADELEALGRFQGRMVLSTDGEILEANSNLASTLGYTRGELVGRVHRSCLHEDDAASDAYARFWETLRAGRFLLGEYRRRAKDGSDVWLRASYTPLRDEHGKITKIIKYAADVTDSIRQRAEAEKSARESAELARVIRDSPNELFIFDAQSLRFIEVNRGGLASLGYSVEEIVGMTPVDIKPEFTEESFREAIAPLANGTTDVLEFTTAHLRKDGTQYDATISLHLTTFKGRAVYVAFVADLTDVQRLEKKLADAQRLEAIGSLAAGIAHEINTPLQFIASNIDFLDRGFGALSSTLASYARLNDDTAQDDLAAALDEIKTRCEENRTAWVAEQIPAAIAETTDGIDRVVSIIAAMKSFSHPGSDSPTTADLNEMVQRTVVLTRNRWKTDATVEVDLDPRLPDAIVYPSGLNQVLVNLVVNAADAIADRRASEPELEGRIAIGTREDNDHLVVEVRDNGCGMPDHVRQRVFEPFFTTKDVGKGTGQGLSIVHNVVVQQHGGSVQVASEPGEGTTFTVRLPAGGPPDAAAAAADARAVVTA